MSSKIIAGTTSGTALNMSADTSGQLEIQTGATPTTAITVDASQNVAFNSATAQLSFTGNGTTSGLIVAPNVSSRPATNNPMVQVTSGNGSGIYGNAGNIVISGRPTDNSPNFGNIYFQTGSTQQNSVSIDASGNLLVGKTTSSYSTSGIRLSNGVGQTGAEFVSSQLPIAVNLLSNTGTAVVFSFNTVDRGNINWNGSTMALTNSSDQRLKQNIVDAPSAIQKINDIKIRSFNFKEDNRHVDYGVVAQELKEVVPSAVFEGVDDENGKIKTPWSVGLEPLIPILVKAIQELNAKVTALETQLGAK